MDQYLDESIDDVVVKAGSIPWTVVSVTPSHNHTLSVSFKDGSRKRVDIKPLLSRRPYETLSDIDMFMTAQARHGTVAWDDDTDIAPEYLYDAGVVEE
ncbi:MAG: DUF2442 domain-containing protein [Coriobacteriia bacterium]|nr:DUF2442 domain-containing protein [Coriobacteriia bacterium]